MKSTTWKVIAIIFIVLFILENVWFIWAILYTNHEEARIKTCYYDICSSNDDAYYETNSKTCVCYNYDLSNELNEVERVSIK